MADLIFLLLLWAFLAGPLASRPLADADIGWHIRNGQQILVTHSVPHTDSFSATTQGKPWFAWEWLYDAALAALYNRWGLNGVQLLAAFLMALTFALTMRWLIRRGTTLPLAIALLLCALAAASVHFSARPHIVSWLLAVVWFALLDRSEQHNCEQHDCKSHDCDQHNSHPHVSEQQDSEQQDSKSNDSEPQDNKPHVTQLPDSEPHDSEPQKSEKKVCHPERSEGPAVLSPKLRLPWRPLYLLPFLMLLWVNLHGGFLLGFVFLAMYALSAIWRERHAPTLRFAHHLTLASLLCLAASLINPYGYKLHLHVIHYLSSRFLLSNIEEFKPPNPHGAAFWFFLVLVAATAFALVRLPRHRRLSHFLVALFAATSGFYAARNLPVSALLLAMVAGPLLTNHSESASDFLKRTRRVAANLARLDLGLRGHLWPAIAMLLALWVASHNGRLGSYSAMNAHFDSARQPVAAVEFLAAQPAAGPVFCPDNWSGYVIYALYPARQVVFDDRHDFYGESMVRNYLKIIRAEPGAQELLDDWHARWTLVPAGSRLALLLRDSPGWTVRYEDGIAVAFQRIDHSNATGR